jgi:hypothetical protein
MILRSIFFGLLFLCSLSSIAQYESAVAYMDYLSSIEGDLAKDYMSYMSAMAHTNSARKMERRRAEVLSTVKEGRKKVENLKPYEGENSLREAYTRYLTILQAVLSEDYAKIVNMEEIADQSYDKMEAYLLAQEKARERLSEATDSLRTSYHSFAAINNVKLVQSENKISLKLKETAAVMMYYNQIYLINFKASKQEGYTIGALNNGDINGVEQNKSTLISYATEGMEKLNRVKAYGTDYSLVIACLKLLEFQKVEAETKISNLTDFLIKKDEFTKFKKEYDSTPPSRRDRNDVDDYNSFVLEMNKMSDTYNKVNDQLNRQRATLNDNWSSAVDKFLDAHIPK